jgi:small-conductance mechanosensitive channel
VHDASGWEVVLRCAIGVVVAVIVGLVVTVLVRRLLLRVGLDATALARPRRSPIVALFVVIALRAVLGASTNRGERGHGLLPLLDIAIIAVVAWLLIEAATIVERAWLEKYPAQGEANLRQRHARTQILLLRRVTVAMIATIAIGAMLWTIPAVQELGAGILASAGVVGIVAGLAAQTSLGNIFAGIQISFTDAIRIGDVVEIDNLWGRIEEITLTYVVLRVWDGTCLILPCTYFNTTRFRNWTHGGTQNSGTIELAVNWKVPLDDLREELRRFLATCDSWDGRNAEIRVDNAIGTEMTLLVVVTAADADAVFDLKWQVREALVSYLQENRPDALPRR